MLLGKVDGVTKRIVGVFVKRIVAEREGTARHPSVVVMVEMFFGRLTTEIEM